VRGRGFGRGVVVVVGGEITPFTSCGI